MIKQLLAQTNTDTPPVLSALTLAILVSSTSAILVKLSDAPSMIKVVYRLFFTVLFLGPITLWWYRDHLRKISNRDLTVAMITGMALGVHYTLWFESLEWTTVAASVTLAQTQTIFVALGAHWLLNERLNRGTVLGVIVGFSGVAIMSIGGRFAGLTDADALFGNSLAVLAGVLFAGYLLAGRSLRQRVAVVPYITIVYTLASIVVLGMALLAGQTVTPTAYPAHELTIFLTLALGPTIFSQGVVNWALAYIESSIVSVAFLSVPIASAILAIFILAEYPGVETIVGGTIVLSGVYLTIRSRMTL